MSLVINALKVRKAFSEPSVPHNPRSSMHIPDLESETGLSSAQLMKTLKVLEKEGIVELEAPECISVVFVNVLKKYKKLMGVKKPKTSYARS